MKIWMNRFAVLAVLGSLVCSAIVAGCGGGDEDDTANTANNAAPAKDKTPDDAQ